MFCGGDNGDSGDGDEVSVITCYHGCLRCGDMMVMGVKKSVITIISVMVMIWCCKTLRIAIIEVIVMTVHSYFLSSPLP